MTLLHDAFTAFISGITTKKPNTEEIYWESESGSSITVECIDAETESYIVRSYYENGKLHYENHYQHGQPHGICKGWYENGQLHYEHFYQHGQPHGIWKGWYKNGKLQYEHPYQHGKRHGISKGWHINGQLYYEQHWEHGKQIK